MNRLLVMISCLILTPQVPFAHESPGSESAPATGSKPAVADDDMNEVPKPSGQIRLPLDDNSSDIEAPFLKKRVAAEFVDLALSDVLQFISEVTDAPVLLDTLSIEEAGMLQDEPVNFSSFGGGSRKRVRELLDAEIPMDQWDEVFLIRVDQLLDLSLVQLGLTWFVEEDIVHVTTREVERERYITKSFDLAPFRERGLNTDTLLRILHEGGSLRFHGMDGDEGAAFVVGDVLTVRQTWHVLREVLGELQSLLAPGIPHSGPYGNEVVQSLAALQSSVSVKFDDIPLIDAIEFLSLSTQTRLHLDRRAIHDSGLLIDEPVNLSLSGKSLKTTLRLLLDDLDLTTAIRSGEVVITTKDQKRWDAIAVSYDVSSLPDPKSFAEMLDAALPGVWRRRHGYGGTIQLFDGSLLFVQQTYQVQQSVSRLLRVHVDKARASKPRSERIQRIIRTYRVPTETADDLLTTLPALIGVGTWKLDQSPDGPKDPRAVGTIRKVAVGQKAVQLPGPKVQPKKKSDGKSKESESAPAPRPEIMLVSESVLIIDQTNEMHKKIDEFLLSLGLGNSALGQKYDGRSGLSGGGFF